MQPGGATPGTFPFGQLRTRALSGAPLHRQLAGNLRALIRSGQVAPGRLLPAEQALARELGISRHTVRHALAELTAEGLLRRSRGRGGGTTVLPAPARPIERSLGSFYAFAWEVRARGHEPRSFVLEHGAQAPAADIAAALRVGDDTLLVRIVRLRTEDGEPLVLETTWLPPHLADCLDMHDLEHGAIYDAFESKLGMAVERAHERISPTVLDGRVARLLGVPGGAPAFRVERTTFANDGPFEWQESIVRGDRFLYSVDLPLSGTQHPEV